MRKNIEIEISLFEKNVDFTIFKENREEKFYEIFKNGKLIETNFGF